MVGFQRQEHKMRKKKMSLADAAREMRESLTDKEREILDARLARAMPLVMKPKTGEKWKHLSEVEAPVVQDRSGEALGSARRHRHAR
jgi:hypothetical protein